MSYHSRDTDEDVSNTLAILKEFDITDPNEEDIALVREVCDKVSQRGAFIIATGKNKLIWSLVG